MCRNTVLLAICLSFLTLLVISLDAVSAQEQIEVIVNDVIVEPGTAGEAYQVTAYVTVVGNDGQPITGLDAGAFVASQDGSKVVLDSATSVHRAMSVVLAIDTSGSTAYQGNMNAVKAPIVNFLDRLKPVDQVAVVFFSDRVVVARQNLSSDFELTKTIINLLQAEPNTGTCLYDAAYESIALAGRSLGSNRALVLLTDGIDEQADRSERCSRHTVDDVIELAQGQSHDISDVRVPIYTIGVGERIDAEELAHIAISTGGAALLTSDVAQVSVMFDTVAARLQNQYMLVYHVEMSGGEHTLAISVATRNSVGVGTGRFRGTEPPPVLSLTGLNDGATLDGHAVVRADIGNEAEIANVVFLVDGEFLSEVLEAPFAADLDSEIFPPGRHALTATAQLDDGSVLSKSLVFEVNSEQSESTIEVTGEEIEQIPASPKWIVAAGLAGAAILLLVCLWIIFQMRAQTQVIGKGSMASGRPRGAAALTMDIADRKYATLRVQTSLTLRRDQVFDLVTNEATIGHGADNYIVIPDELVSRNHAMIHREDDGFRVFDCNSMYGTFVNGERVGEQGLPIQDGNTLLLGTRTAMSFHVLQYQKVPSEESSFDPGEQPFGIVSDDEYSDPDDDADEAS
ncbi:MAG: FHA domain-containing protein [Anaerolineae bacterium]|nr:FHA domain-containing protein [Anaerolineae bacterium]